MKRVVWFPGSPGAAAVGGFMLLPASFLCFTGILLTAGIPGPNDLLDRALAVSALARFLIHPIVVMGGPSLAAILNLFGVVGFRAGKEDDGFSATLFVRRKPLNIAVALAGAGLLCMLVIYLIGENFVISLR